MKATKNDYEHLTKEEVTEIIKKLYTYRSVSDLQVISSNKKTVIVQGKDFLALINRRKFNSVIEKIKSKT
jgi:hypothetical protein